MLFCKYVVFCEWTLCLVKCHCKYFVLFLWSVTVKTTWNAVGGFYPDVCSRVLQTCFDTFRREQRELCWNKSRFWFRVCWTNVCHHQKISCLKRIHTLIQIQDRNSLNTNKYVDILIWSIRLYFCFPAGRWIPVPVAVLVFPLLVFLTLSFMSERIRANSVTNKQTLSPLPVLGAGKNIYSNTELLLIRICFYSDYFSANEVKKQLTDF